MYTRHDDLPVLSAWPSRVQAEHYNIAARALPRLGPWLRLPLPGLAALELILQARDWIVVDPTHADIPVAAWAGLDPAPDRGLHEPVTCELRYYHGAAGKVAAQVPGIMACELRARLETQPAEGPTVIPFPGAG